MARTTSDEVSSIIEVDTNISLTPFIEVANELVTECCTGGNHTTLRLTQIEKWLAAHFYTCRDMRAVLEKAGSVSQTLQSKVDLGFDTSHYGQMAMRLDTEGNLAALNERIKKGKRSTVGITWLGTADPTDSDTD
jgi:hypothetical protein